LALCRRTPTFAGKTGPARALQMNTSWLVAFVVTPIAVLFVAWVGVHLHERSIRADERAARNADQHRLGTR
jgi:hypothetical protein